jgi:hypothetical protein
MSFQRSAQLCSAWPRTAAKAAGSDGTSEGLAVPPEPPPGARPSGHGLVQVVLGVEAVPEPMKPNVTDPFAGTDRL